MSNKGVLTKILAIAGTLLVWFPLLAPILFSTSRLAEGGVFHFDYLMPAELFLAAFLGGGLLFWAALRARSHIKIFRWGLVIAVVALAGSQGLAVASGLATGEIGRDTVWWIIVLILLAVYVLALLGMGIGGITLLRELFRKK